MSSAQPYEPPRAVLLAIGQNLRERGVGPGDVLPGWVRMRLAWDTKSDEAHRLTDAEAVQLAERACRLAEPPADLLPQRGPTPLPGFGTADIWNAITPVPYLIKAIAIRGGLSILFGMSGHLKTATAVALALAVATGREFAGFRVEHAGVLYIVGEGHAGMRKRVRAWLIEHGYDATSDQPAIYFTKAGADLIGNPTQVRATVEVAEAVLGVSIGLVVVDTLTANAGPADLNDTRDMQLVIAAAQGAKPEAAVLAVHHVGHGDPDRERGAYSLIAAADVRLQAVYDEIGKVLELRWKKLKDDDMPESVLFRPKVVSLGWEDDDGDELTSVVLDHLPAGTHVPVPHAKPLGKNQVLALETLRQLLAKTRKNLQQRGDDPAGACILTSGWRAELLERGLDRFRYREVVAVLQERGLIRFDGPHVHPGEGLAK